jgi:hypothetical protein
VGNYKSAISHYALQHRVVSQNGMPVCKVIMFVLRGYNSPPIIEGRLFNGLFWEGQWGGIKG